MNVNEEIRAQRVRVVAQDGEQLGILPIEEALETAFSRGLDLVEVSENSTPPVCRIMDYGKFKFQQNKRKKDARKRQTVIQIKEVKLRLKTEANDVSTKIKHLLRFIGEGNKVKISVVFRGREITHPELAVAMFERIMETIKDDVTIESQPRMEGRAMVMMVGPRSDKSS